MWDWNLFIYLSELWNVGALFVDYDWRTLLFSNNHPDYMPKFQQELQVN